MEQAPLANKHLQCARVNIWPYFFTDENESRRLFQHNLFPFFFQWVMKLACWHPCIPHSLFFWKIPCIPRSGTDPLIHTQPWSLYPVSVATHTVTLLLKFSFCIVKILLPNNTRTVISLHIATYISLGLGIWSSIQYYWTSFSFLVYDTFFFLVVLLVLFPFWFSVWIYSYAFTCFAMKFLSLLTWSFRLFSVVTRR
jgi:hypothetical protein